MRVWRRQEEGGDREGERLSEARVVEAAGPRRPREALGREEQMAREVGSLFSLSLTLKEKNRDKKEKKGRLGEEVGHADNFPGLAKM